MFTRELAPSFGIVEATWEENDNQTSAFSNDGAGDVLEVAEPFWTINVKVEVISEDHFDEWDAFLARRRLQECSFTIWRSLRVRPRDRLILSDAGLALEGINVANSQISLTGYGAGRAASIGDMISYRTLGGGYWVGKVVTPATANGVGAITVNVWPRPWAPHATTPDPRRFRALGEFRLAKPPKKTQGNKNWRISFEAEQVLA